MALQQSMQQAAAAAAGHGAHGGPNAGMLGTPFSAHAAAMQLGLTNPAFAAAYNQPGLGAGQVTGTGTLTPAGKRLNHLCSTTFHLVSKIIIPNYFFPDFV